MNSAKKRREMERKIVERLLLGSGLNRIVRELGGSKRRVMTVRAKADEAGYLDGRKEVPPYPETLFPEVLDGRTERKSAVWEELKRHQPWIRERLEAGWHAVTVYEELPCRVPRSNFYRFLQRHRLNEVGKTLRRVVPEIVHAPGEALLVDWGYLWTIEEEGKKKKLWVFLGVLGYSRYLVARVMTSCDLEETLCQLSSMYEELGGVPRRTTSDNPKVFALKADRYEPMLNPGFERFAAHYGTLIECLPPRDPEKKGKVERPMPYIRRLLESYTGDRNDVAAIQAYLTAKLAIANARKHGTTHERPCERLSQQIASARAKNSLDSLFRKILSSRLWILDDWGVVSMKSDIAEEVFDLLDRRRHSSALILTSNRDVDEWGTVFPDPVLAGAAIDRLFDHATTVTFLGNSYRLRRKILVSDSSQFPKINGGAISQS